MNSLDLIEIDVEIFEIEETGEEVRVDVSQPIHMQVDLFEAVESGE